MAILTTTFTNTKDIDDFFQEKTGKGFVDYFNDKHAGIGSFAKSNGKSSVPAISSKNKGNWDKVWNSIDSLFGRSEINIAEFLSVNVAMQMETGSSFTPGAELIGSSSRGVPGMSYAFNPVKGIKSSYNSGNTATDLGNKTAFKLFNDADYVNAHGHKPFGNILKNTSDSRWDTGDFPFGFSGSSDTKKETDRSGKRSGFLFEADFMKFRGRGFIQTTGRGNYIQIIKFIMSYSGDQKIVKKFKDKWSSYGSNHNLIATISSNTEWDELFNKSDLIIPNVAVDIHASKAGRRNGGPSRSQYNKIDVSVSEDDVLKKKGPVWWVGKRINGADKYANALLARVVQVIDDLEDEDPDPDNPPEEEPEEIVPNDPVDNNDTSDTDTGNEGSSNDQLPKMEGINNFFTADTTKLKLEPIRYEQPDSQDKKEKDAFDAGNLPIIAYGNKPIDAKDIKSLVLSSNQLLPTCRVTFQDPLNLVNDKAFPLDDTTLKVFLNSKTKSLRHILLEFKIVNFKKNKEWITVDGVLNVNRYFLRKFEALQDKTSFKALEEFSKLSGTGFSSNVQDTKDEMTWINPGDTGSNFVREILKNSYTGDESFMWGYVDFYYNFNYIDIEQALSLQIDNQGGVYDSGVKNLKEINADQEEQVAPLMLSNDKSTQMSNSYFESYNVINKSSSISLKKGYLNRVKFYNQQNIDFNVFDIDSITSDADNKIIMKGAPQDEEFFNEHVTSTYTGKLDPDNAHDNYNYAPVQNNQNIDDIQKIGLVLTLPNPNFNLYRFQKLEVVISNNKQTMTNQLLNQRLKGEWLIIDIKFNMVSGAFKQVLSLIKRELELSDEEQQEEPTPTEAPASAETGQSEPDTEDAVEDVPPPEPEPEPQPEEDPITFNFEQIFKNSSEIDEYFASVSGNSAGYVDWANDTISNDTDKGIINKDTWSKVWNSIDVIFGKESVNMAEFLSLSTLLYLNQNYTSKAETDMYELYDKYNDGNLNGHGGDDFKALEELSRTDYRNTMSIPTAQNADYNKAHGHLTFGSALQASEPLYFGTLIPTILENDKYKSILPASYIAQADFWKVRGRGLIITASRTHYKDLVEYVLKYSGDNNKISKIKNKWVSYEIANSGKSIAETIGSSEVSRDVLNIVITISNDTDWKELFSEIDFQIVAVGLRLQGTSAVGNRETENIHHIDVKGKSEDKIETAMSNLAKSSTIFSIRTGRKQSIPKSDTAFVNKHLSLIKKQVSVLRNDKNVESNESPDKLKSKKDAKGGFTF